MCDIFVILAMFVGNSIPAWHIESVKIDTFYPILYPFGNVAYMGSVFMIVLLSFERFKGGLISKSFSLCSISKQMCQIHQIAILSIFLLSTVLNTMVPVSTVQPSLNEAVGLQIFFHHSDILSCITFYIK